MNKTSKSQNRQAFWQRHLEAWSDSSLSQTEYCRSNNLAPHQFSYWKHKIQDKSDQPSNQRAGFVPVYQAPPNHKGAGLSIALPNGLTVQGIHQNNLTTVAQLIRVL